jgi:hypothetical protein
MNSCFPASLLNYWFKNIPLIVWSFGDVCPWAGLMFYREFVVSAVSKLTLNAVSSTCECGQIYVFIFNHTRGFLLYFFLTPVKPVKFFAKYYNVVKWTVLLLCIFVCVCVCVCVCIHENVVNLKTLKVLIMLCPVDLTVHLTLFADVGNACCLNSQKKTHFIAHDWLCVC